MTGGHTEVYRGQEQPFRHPGTRRVSPPMPCSMGPACAAGPRKPDRDVMRTLHKRAPARVLHVHIGGRRVRRAMQNQHRTALIFLTQQRCQLGPRAGKVDEMDIHRLFETRIKLQQTGHLRTAGAEPRRAFPIEEIRFQEIELVTFHELGQGEGDCAAPRRHQALFMSPHSISIRRCS